MHQRERKECVSYADWWWGPSALLCWIAKLCYEHELSLEFQSDIEVKWQEVTQAWLWEVITLNILHKIAQAGTSDFSHLCRGLSGRTKVTCWYIPLEKVESWDALRDACWRYRNTAGKTTWIIKKLTVQKLENAGEKHYQGRKKSRP